jgi:hypothetical protein
MHLSLSPSRFTAVRFAFWLSAAGLLALAGYLLFAPSGLNECPALAKSLYYSRANASCIQAGRVLAVAGSVVGSIAAAGAALTLRRRDDV